MLEVYSCFERFQSSVLQQVAVYDWLWIPMQVEQAAEDVKRREATLVRREADLSRLEAAASTLQADSLKRDVELSNREQALAAQLAKVKAAESQLQSKQLEAKELQASHCLVVNSILYSWEALQTSSVLDLESSTNTDGQRVW